MNRHSRDLKLSNVVTVFSDPDDPLLAWRAIGRIFICNPGHHVENKTKYLSLMKKMAKPGGKAIILGYKPAPLPK